MLPVFALDREKAGEVLLYVAARCPDMYRAMKALYVADKLHLERYGRTIAGDWYVAMDNGATPSFAYDLVKDARDPSRRGHVAIQSSLAVAEQHRLCARREPDLDYLSESDRECLDEACEACVSADWEAYHRAHDEPWESAHEVSPNSPISFESIVLSLKDGAALLAYLTE